MPHSAHPEAGTLVSVVITTYNGARYLAQQLDSVLGQDWPNLEIIVSDDASSDDTLAIVEDYARRDARIVIIRHEQNVGLHANLQEALRAARGEYIAISDQDDIWQCDKISQLMAAIGSHIAIFTDSILIDSDGKPLDKTVLESIRLKDPDNCTRLLNLMFRNVVSGHALLFHRALLDAVLPFSDALIFDHHLALCAALCGGLVFHRTPLVWHRIHGANHTNAALAPDVGKRSRGRTRVMRREQLMGKLRIFRQMQAANLHALREKGFAVDTENLQVLANIAQAADASSQGFFSPGLLWQFAGLSRRHRYYPAGNLLKRAFRLAKGERWYALFDRRASNREVL